MTALRCSMFFLTLLGSLLAPAMASAVEQRPNLVLFLSDDHGYWDSPVYGSKVVETPNLERLARDGMTFTHAFVGSPSCAPSRAILMTGLMSARNGAQANHSQVRPEVKTLPTYLKECGYRVAHFGKSHFNPPSKYRDFEFVRSVHRHGPLDADLDTDAVERWLAESRESDDRRPVCMVVCSFSPHVYWPENDGYDTGNVELPPTFVDTPETREYRTQYYTDVTLMDRRIGKVYDSVRRHLGDNTLFLYMADHGAQWPFGKWNLYDAGIRVPSLAVWPGVISPGSRTEAMVNSVDLLPTFVELAGGTVPETLDGRSFAKVLRGQTDQHRTHIHSTHSGDGDMNVYPMRSVRTRKFKYILNLHPEFEYTTHIDKGNNKDGLKFWKSWERAAETDPKAATLVRRYHQRPREELYDVEADPHELTNLADHPDHQATLAKLRERVETWMQEQGDEGQVFGKPRFLSDAAAK